jgi:hypothetical protein
MIIKDLLFRPQYRLKLTGNRIYLTRIYTMVINKGDNRQCGIRKYSQIACKFFEQLIKRNIKVA